MKKVLSGILSIIIIFSASVIPVSAHNMSPWINNYPETSANSTFAFGFDGYAHISGKTVKYYWVNDTTKENFNTALTSAFSQGWGNLITGTEMTLYYAHTGILYDPAYGPDNEYAATYRKKYDENHNYIHHIRTGYGDSAIIVYRDVLYMTNLEKRQVFSHELGHLWAITDLYDYNSTLNSIYSQPFTFSTATRHDKNAMRISLNNLWFDPGTNTAWYYQPTPGTFYERGNANMDGGVYADDASLVLRASAGLETLSTVQKKLADVDGDGSITAADASLILQYSSHLIQQFPADG